jgi:CheY-like chemotaxis protein
VQTSPSRPMDLRGFEELRRGPPTPYCAITMPVMYGLEFATRMRRNPRYRNGLLLAITGRASPADIMET